MPRVGATATNISLSRRGAPEQPGSGRGEYVHTRSLQTRAGRRSGDAGTRRWLVR